MSLKETAVRLFLKGVEAVKPENLIPEKVYLKKDILFVEQSSYHLPEKIYLFGSGKASVEMAKALLKILGERVADGLVVCNYTEKIDRIQVVEGNHPVPDEKSLKAGSLMIKKLSSLSENDFFIYLLSGGSSALMEKPLKPITLEDLKKTTQLLLENSVPIEEINVVRKHISAVKGGRLGRSTKAKGVVLVISDVIGDDLFTIGSAPLYYDKSTFEDAYRILEKYSLLDKVPASVKQVIQKGLKGQIEETPKTENPHIKHHIIGNNLTALKKIKEESPFPAYIMTSQLHGEAREVAKAVVSIGKEVLKSGNPFDPPAVLLFGGETTVTVRGTGRGGRNQEFCLSALQELKDTPDVTVLSAGTDGIDGNTTSAGAVVDIETYRKAVRLNLDVNRFLENNDSHSFFGKTGGLINTGYTGTNVMDIVIMIVGGSHDSTA
ncbi:glycerate kinase type-2 family protein [Persephonella sp.]